MAATRPTEQLREHERASLVPAMSAGEYRALLDDIAARGLLVPLEITRQGVVLDGRHRLRAARQLGLARVPVRVVDTHDQVGYIAQAAINRRHLSASQRAAVVVELEEYERERERASARQLANLKQRPVEVAMLPRRGERSRESAA